MHNAARGTVTPFPTVSNDVPVTDNDATIFEFPSYFAPAPVIA